MVLLKSVGRKFLLDAIPEFLQWRLFVVNLFYATEARKCRFFITEVRKVWGLLYILPYVLPLYVGT
jgi:hypothetical protein